MVLLRNLGGRGVKKCPFVGGLRIFSGITLCTFMYAQLLNKKFYIPSFQESKCFEVGLERA